MNSIEIPPIIFDVINMPSNYFNKICRDLNSLADTVEIRSINKKLLLTFIGKM